MTIKSKVGALSVALFASFTANAAYSERVTHKNQQQLKTALQSQSLQLPQVQGANAAQSPIQFLPITSESALSTQKAKADYQRYQQYVLDTPVWGQQLSMQLNKSQHVSGFFALNINDAQLKQTASADFDEATAAKNILKRAKLPGFTRYGVDNNQRYVYLHKGKAVFVRLIELHVHAGSKPLAPTALVLESSHEVLEYWNDIHHSHATGPGGNEKMGRVEFGTDLPALDVTQDGETCYLENEKVKTVTLEEDENNTQAFSFPCSRNEYKEINGAYSPLNEAHGYGTAVFDMYNDWYGTAPLTFQLLMRVHYGTSYENAFWDGRAMTFGDGASRFHPLTSLDIVSHEVSHGFTDQNSDLIYANQSGGINEAYSDIAGEAAEFYLRGENDWLIGADVMKQAQALRFFETPSLDGSSIDHARDYYSGLDVHYSSGVFNRAFYLLANTEGWGVRKAFDLMVRANQQYWVASSDFVDGACGVVNSAIDLGYSIPDVIAAFDQVGVECDNIQFVDADEDGMDDNWELQYGLNPADPNDADLDLDEDTLTNLQEYRLRSLPNNNDSDNDGLLDGVEVNEHNTSPTSADTDSDVMPDGWEVQYALNPISSADAATDIDEDGFSNLIEYLNETDPTDVSSFPEGTFEYIYSFEDGLVPAEFSFSDAANPWFITELNGNKVLTSNDINDDQRTSARLVFVSEPGTLSFNYSVDSEADYDFLEVYLNGELLLSDSAELWWKFETAIPAGEHTLEFVYVKDFSVSHGTDSVYIDNLHIGSGVQATDSDNDGMPDYWEQRYGLDIHDANDASLDADSDGLSNLAEFQNSTEPSNADTDNDGMPDGWEVQYGLNPTNSEDAELDADNDGFTNLIEYRAGTEPNNPESFPVALDITTSFEENTLPEWLTTPDDSNAAWLIDTDKASDGQQSIKSGIISDGQMSSFVITGYFEEGLLLFDLYQNIAQGFDFFAVGINGQYFYSDYSDAEWITESINIPRGLNTIEFRFIEEPGGYTSESFIHLDNFNWLPNGSVKDSDKDGMPDLWEIQYGLDINDSSDAMGDLDDDGLSNFAEYQNQTVPNDPDSDADGMPDGWEVQYGFAPTDPSDAVLDADDDGFSNLDEYLLGTEPNNPESFPVALDITTSFEENTLPEWLSTPDSSNAAWFIDTEMTTEGQQSIRSGDISDDDVSSFVVSGMFAEGKLLFDLYQDAETCCDYLQIFINDEEVYTSRRMSSQTWLSQLISVPEGINTIEFTYRKDGSYSTEEDLVRLDNFIWLANNSTRDTDNDGLPDVWELEYGLDWNDATDAQTDADFDGLTALQEFQAQTSPINADTDSDQLPDGFELDNTLNPLDATDAAQDNDSDSYTNLQEFYANSDVNSSASLPRQFSQVSEDFEGGVLPEWFVQTVDSTAHWELSTGWSQSGSQSLRVNADDYYNRAGFVIAGEFEAGLMVFDTYDASNMQVFVNDQLVKELNSYRETMSAITLASGFNVVRFVARAGSHIDDISFGVEIPADRDSDNDGIPDVWELEHGLNPRYDYDAQRDSDYDGLSNLVEFNLNANPNERDTDNDGVQDSEDSHPNDASLGENQAPVFGDLSPKTIEAQGVHTWITNEYKPEATDNGHLEPDVFLGSGGAYQVGEHVVTWRARDYVGNETEDHYQTIHIVDTTAPEYRRALSDAVVKNHEQLVALLKERNVFFDRVDQYDITINIDPNVSLHAGNRRIPVSVTDKSGNSETHLVDVSILPKLSIPETLVIAQEGELSLPFTIDGDLPRSFVSFSLEVNGNSIQRVMAHSEWLDVLPGVRVRSPQILNGSRIKITDVTGAYVEEQDTSVLVVQPEQYMPIISAVTKVGQIPAEVVSSDQAYAELLIGVEDLNVGDEHEIEVSSEFQWLYKSYETRSRAGRYGFNPSEIDVGTYNVTFKVTETNTESPLSSEIVVPVTIIAPLELTDADTDNDGISDAEEGITDRDRDGIVDYLDAISSPSIATLGDEQSLNVLDMAARVTLGQVKLGLTDGFATDMSITTEMVEQYSESEFGSTEQLFDPHYRDISKTASVTAVLLAGNTSATLTLPSQVTTLLDTTPKVRALTSNGWVTLPSVTNDAACANCVAFTVTDGGDMDLDGVVNGQVDVVTKLAVADANRLPELVFEAPTSINENTTFELDASQSFDLDKDSISFKWAISGANIELTDQEAGKATLVVGELAESVDSMLTLTLDDGYGTVDHEFKIAFNHVNALPVITLIDSLTVDENTVVTLSASATDKESNALSFEWLQVTGMAVELADTSANTLTFTAPEVTEQTELEFKLSVTDDADTAESIVKVVVNNIESNSGSDDSSNDGDSSADNGSDDSSGNSSDDTQTKADDSSGGSMPLWLTLGIIVAALTRRRANYSEV